MADIPKKTDTPEEKFLAFLYPEVKDLAKHFLTLVSAVLVFSVTFSEKIVSFATATRLQKLVLVVSWLLWICALIFIGLAIFINFVTAGQALRHRERDLKLFIRCTYVSLDIGGVCFVAGLFVLALSAVSKLIW